MSQTFSPDHPYFPPGIAIVGYIPNSYSMPELVTRFAIAIIAFISFGLFVARSITPSLSMREQAVLCWFLLCGFLHCFFEGYFVLYHTTLPGSQALFAQLWKEYALSDSRYLTSDTFMVCIETTTALLWGPLCFAIAVHIIKDSIIRVPLRMIMCFAHLFSVALYYGTCFYDEHYWGVWYSRPEFLYYWVYYIGLNAPWVLVPAMIIYYDMKTYGRSFWHVDLRIPKPKEEAESDDSAGSITASVEKGMTEES